MIDLQRLAEDADYWSAMDPTGGVATHYDPHHGADCPWIADYLDKTPGWYAYHESTGNWVPDDSGDEYTSEYIPKEGAASAKMPSDVIRDDDFVFMGGSVDGMTGIYSKEGFIGEITDSMADEVVRLVNDGMAFRAMVDKNMEVYVSETLCLANPWRESDIERGIPTEIVDENQSKSGATRKAIFRAKKLTEGEDK